MMPSDALLASLCADIYKPTAIIGAFDHFDAGLDDGVCWALKHLDGFDVLVFRGSLVLRDWIADLRALAVPTRIGHVHVGFFSSMEHAWGEARALLTQPVIVTGHSLGAARAGVAAGLMAADNEQPIARVVFGEPKPGLADFAARIAHVPGRSYRNGDARHHDLVTDVPFSFPPLQYVHPTPIIPVCCKPEGLEFEDLGVFAWHHVSLYETALAVLASQEKAA